jgi:hypothetical protein
MIRKWDSHFLRLTVRILFRLQYMHQKIYLVDNNFVADKIKDLMQFVFWFARRRNCVYS